MSKLCRTFLETFELTSLNLFLWESICVLLLLSRSLFNYLILIRSARIRIRSKKNILSALQTVDFIESQVLTSVLKSSSISILVEVGTSLCYEFCYAG